MFENGRRQTVETSPANMIRYCRRCKTVQSDRAIVCSECGVPLSSPAPHSVARSNVPDDDHSADQHAIAAPAEARASVSALAAYLARASIHERGKARAIFRWLAANIEYDVAALAAPSKPSNAPDDVLRRRRAVCQGFSDLFVALAHGAGLNAAAVSGYARGAFYRAAEPYTEQDRHAWNAIKIDGGWMLLDPTWGAGHVDVRDGAYTRCFDPFWFLTPPDHFIHTHWPTDTRWQLLSRPLSLAEQEQLPYYRSEWFTLGLSAPLLHGHTISCSDSTEITIHAPDDVAVMGQLGENDTLAGLPWTLSQHDKTGWIVRIVPPAVGSHVLRLYCRRAEASAYAWCADFRLAATHVTSPAVPFPRQLAGFEQHRARLVSPVSGVLRHKDRVRFEVYCPDVADVAAIQGREWTHLKRAGRTFAEEITVKQGQLTLAACAATRGSATRSYDALLQYDVR